MSRNSNSSSPRFSIFSDLHLHHFYGIVYYVITLALLFALATAAEEVVCPQICTCAEAVAQCVDSKVENCQKNGEHWDSDGEPSELKITRVPRQIPHNATLTELLIARTCIQYINVSDFRNFQNLQQLDLNTNNIYAIEDGSFLELHKLESLILRRNKLSFFSELTFAGLGNLKVLEVSYNLLDNLGTNWFRPLVSLENLDLARNIIEHLDDGAFAGLANLRVLNLTRNNFLRLSGDYLSSLRGLQCLFLDDNKIITLDNDTFAQMGNLRLLSFTGNRDMSNQRIQPGAFGNGGSGQPLPLEKLSLKGTTFQTVPTELFRTLGQLKSLDLSQTDISVLGNQSFKWLVSLVNLTLDSLDHLTTVEHEAFQGLQNLRNLKLTNNRILYNISYTTFLPLHDLDYLDLRNNRLQTLRAGMANWTSIGVVDLRGNPFRCDCQTAWMLTLLTQRQPPTTPLSTTASTVSKFGTYTKQEETSHSHDSINIPTYCSNYSATGPSSHNVRSEVSTAAFAREIACDSPRHLNLRCIASLSTSDFRCPNGQEARQATDDTDQRIKVGVIAASLTCLLLFTCALFLKFRRRLCSIVRRQYRYKAQTDRFLNGGSPTAEIVDLETTQLEDFESEAETNGKL